MRRAVTLSAPILAHVGEREADTNNAELAKSAKDVADLPFARGVMVSTTLAASSTTTITHKLGKTPQGWIPCGWSGAGGFYEASKDSRSLKITNSTATDIKLQLWVY